MYAACARAVASASPVASSCSRPYSRNVSSIMKRGSRSSEAALHEQAVVHERGDAIQDVDAEILEGVAHGLGGLERAAAGEYESRRKSFCSAGDSRS